MPVAIIIGIAVVAVVLLVAIDKMRGAPKCTQCGGPLGAVTPMKKVNGKWERLCPACRGN
jgi:hypothetical protein